MLHYTWGVMAVQLVPMVASVVGAVGVVAWRTREANSTLSTRKIVIPPLAMSTGFTMFLLPASRIPWTWALIAFALGALVLSYPLIRTSHLRRDGDVVTMTRSKAFLGIVLALFALRLALRIYVERYVTTLQSGAIFFVLAFGMIVSWRGEMYSRYRKLMDEPAR